MKRILFASLLVLMPTMASAQLACGFPPFPPLGCQGRPVCICTADGCQWIFTNCR